MSNEDLVNEIQRGRPELMGQLWEQIERLVRWKAKRVITALDGIKAVEFDDLYQSGYIALDEAVQTYRPDMGQFTTWFMFYLKSAFCAATGYRTLRDQRDPLRTAGSLNAPVIDKEGNTTEVGDLVPDLAATQMMEAAEDSIFNEQLRAALNAALDSLPEDHGEILRLRYYDARSQQEVATIRGTDRNEVCRIERKAIRELRQPQRSRHLRSFYDFDFFTGTGLQSFVRTGMSAQERYVIRKEGMENE